MRTLVSIAAPAALVASFAVGFAPSLSTAATVPVYVQGPLGTLDETELARLGTVVTGCWQTALDDAERICIVSDDDGGLRVDLDGHRRLTRGEAKAELQARRPLGRGAVQRREEHCQLRGVRLSAARDLEQAAWGGWGALRTLCARQAAGGRWEWYASRGVVEIDEDELVTRAQRGDYIEPVPSPVAQGQPQ